MIKFFRNIRKKLLKDGNTSKYLKYAIGEIVLVVIGILIALQINNWNEFEKSKSIEKEYLKKLSDDISYMADMYELKKNEFPNYIKSAENALLFLESLGNRKELEGDFYNTLVSHQTLMSYPAQKTTFEEMVNLGILARLNNDILKNKVTEIYNKIEEGNNVIVYFREELGRASQSIYNEVIFSYSNSELTVTYEIETLVNNKPFINALVEVIDARKDFFQTLTEVEPLLKETELLLLEELKTTR